MYSWGRLVSFYREEETVYSLWLFVSFWRRCFLRRRRVPGITKPVKSKLQWSH